ncbi:hypothetical protein BH09BAC5_BH09BAC5_28260 [soil metagenome]
MVNRAVKGAVDLRFPDEKKELIYAIMQQTEKIEELTQHLSKCVRTNLELVKMEATERSSVIGAEIISSMVIASVVMLFILFSSLVAGFYLSTLFGTSYAGFAIVAGFYFILAIVLFLARKKIMRNPLRDRIIRIIYSKN